MSKDKIAKELEAAAKEAKAPKAKIVKGTFKAIRKCFIEAKLHTPEQAPFYYEGPENRHLERVDT